MDIRRVPGSRVKPQGTFTIKIISLAILALLAWPVPAMVSFTNTEEAVVLGRYTLKYFVFLVGYMSEVVLWAWLTLRTILRLTTSRLAEVRQSINEHVHIVAAALVLLIIGWIGIRGLTLAELVILPATFREPMTLIPSTVSVLLLVLAVLVSDQSTIQHLIHREEASARHKPGTWLHLPPLPKSKARFQEAIGPASLVVIASILIVLVARRDYWNFPLGLDPSVHIFLGQHVLKGGIPYETLLYFHPPLRFAISVLWSLGAQLTGLPLIAFVRVVELGVALAVLAVTYGLGRKLAGRPVGGLLAAAVLLSTEHLNELLILGPTFRATTLLFMIIAMWAAQRRAWFWASTAATLSASLWAPAGVSVIAIALSALAQNGEPRSSAFLRTVSGSLLVLGVAGVSLSLVGVLEEAYAQNVVSILRLLTRGNAQPVLTVLRQVHIPALLWVLRGDWEIVALMVTGIVTTLAMQGVREVSHSTDAAPLLLTAALLGGVFVVNFDGSVRDSVMLVAVVAPFGGKAVSDMLSRLDSASESSRHSLRSFLEWAVLAVVLILGVSDAVEHRRFLYSLATVSLVEQQEMAEQLEAALQPDETVQCVGNLWFLNFSGRENAAPFIQWGPQGLSAIEAAGWTLGGMIHEVDSQQPVVVMVWPGSPRFLPDEVYEWLNRSYTLMGTLDPDSTKPQSIYVRRGHDEVEAVVASWPLETRNE